MRYDANYLPSLVSLIIRFKQNYTATVNIHRQGHLNIYDSQLPVPFKIVNGPYLKPSESITLLISTAY